MTASVATHKEAHDRMEEPVGRHHPEQHRRAGRRTDHDHPEDGHGSPARTPSVRHRADLRRPADTILFAFAGSAAEFALNQAVDWLFNTGKLPADPLGRLFSTARFAQDIAFADEATARR